MSKKIKLYGFNENGQPDKTNVLHPETDIASVVGLQQALDNKQGELTPSEKSAVDSGITSEKVEQYDGYAEQIAGKQDTIEDLQTIREGAQAGASAVQPEDLNDYVLKTTEIGGTQIGNGINEVQDLKYDEVEIERVIGVDLAVAPNWEQIKELMPDWDYQQIYYDGENGISIWLYCQTDSTDDLFWQLSISLDDWDTQHYYTIYNRNVMFMAKPSSIHFDANKWYFYDTNEETTMPEIELNIDNIYEHKDELFYCIVDVLKEKIKVNRSIKEKNEDIKNWQYNKEEKYYIPEEYETYPLNNEVSQENMQDLLERVLSSAYNRSKYSQYMWGIGNYIIDSTSNYMEWTFYNPTSTKWENLTLEFVGMERPEEWQLKCQQIFYYQGRTFIANGSSYVDINVTNCIYEATFNPNTKTLTITYHELVLNPNIDDTIFATGVFEWDNKLLFKKYGNNEIYELDLDNFTASLTSYRLCYYTYNNGEKTLWTNPSNITYSTYCKWQTPTQNQILAVNYNGSEISRIRHINEDDASHLYDPTQVLTEYDLILERVDENDMEAGTNSGYNALSNRFTCYDENNNRYVATFTYIDGNKTFWIFNESTNNFEQINTSLEEAEIDNFYQENLFYVNGVLHFYLSYYRNNGDNYERVTGLYKQANIENGEIVFEQLDIDETIDEVKVYTNINANEDEVATITCNYNSEIENYEFRLNNTYYYRGGSSWLDSEGNEADVSNLKITYDYSYSNNWADTLIYYLAQLRYYVITTVDEKINEPLKDKIYAKTEKIVEVSGNFEDGNTYSFKENMEFEQADGELFESLSDGDYIYLDEEDYISITYHYDDMNYVCYLEYDDDGDFYRYIIYNDYGFINQWDDSIPNSLLIHLDCIENMDILKRILDTPMIEKTVLETQTMGEKIADLPNWDYENGVYDIPKWDICNIENTRSGSVIIYEQTNICEIIFREEDSIKSFDIYDVKNNKGYFIYDNSYYYWGTTYEANTWYSWNLEKDDEPVKCDTPKIILDNQYVLEEQIFNALYGSTTLKEKIDSIENSLLKDKIYDKVVGDLVDGEEYTISDDFVDFFEKYGNGQSTLIYGEVPYTPVTPAEPMLASVSNNEEPTQTRDGAILEPSIDVPSYDTPTITGIYLWTDSSPVINPKSSVKGETRDGGLVPYVPVLGGSSIELYTTQGTLIYYQSGNSWMYNDNEFPVSQIPSLVLDMELVNPEAVEMLKDFLHIATKTQTLKEKFDEVEAKIEESANAPLKDKLYEEYEITDDNFVNGHTYNFKEPNDLLSAIRELYDSNGYHYIYDAYNNEGYEIEYYRSSYSYNDSLYMYIQKDGDNITYYYDSYENSWMCEGEKVDFNELLPLEYKSIYSTNDTALALIVSLTSKILRTLGEKNEDLPNWTYETIHNELEDGSTYPLLDNYSNSFFTKYENLFTTTPTPIYMEEVLGGDSTSIYLATFDDDLVIIYVHFDYSTETSTAIGYSKNNEGWFLMSSSDLEFIYPLESESTPSLILSSVFIRNEEVLKDILGVYDRQISLDEKLKYLITDYTENSGALTSITVKDKSTGEPTVLTVGSGGSQLYQHTIMVKNNSSNADTIERASIVIINNSNEEINTKALLLAYCQSRGALVQNDEYWKNPIKADIVYKDGSLIFARGVIGDYYQGANTLRGAVWTGTTINSFKYLSFPSDNNIIIEDKVELL